MVESVGLCLRMTTHECKWSPGGMHVYRKPFVSPLLIVTNLFVVRMMHLVTDAGSDDIVFPFSGHLMMKNMHHFQWID